MDNTHSMVDPRYGVIGFVLGALANILENPYTQDFLHGLISGTGGAIAMILGRWFYKKFTKKTRNDNTDRPPTHR